MHFSIKIFFLVVCLLSTLTGCGRLSPKQQLIKDMASLDGTYIASLIFINAGKQHETELAMDRFVERWNGFRDTYYNLELKYGQDIIDAFWREDFDKINRLVVTAESFVSGQQLSRANEKLMPIKLIMAQMRRRHGLEYYLDALADFQQATLDMRQPLQGKAKLKERDVSDLRELFQAAQKSLSALAKTKINRRYFPMSGKQQKAIAKRLANEQKLMGGVAAAITSRDIPTIASAIEALQPDLALTYRAFGATQPIFDQVLKERKEKERKTTTTTLKKKKTNPITKKVRRRR